MRMIIGGLAVALALGGCGGGGDTGGETKVKTMTVSSPFIEQLKALSTDNQGLALRRAVQDSQQACKRVVQSGYQEDYKNLSVWNLKCTDGEYALYIAPTGDVQVRPCEHSERLGLPKCRFEAAPQG